MAPSAPNVLYVGTGEADMRSDIAQGEGMYKSADAGKPGHSSDSPTAGRSAASWSIRAIPTWCSSPRWAIPMARMPSVACSVRRTAADTGSKVLYQNPDTGAIDLAFEPGNPDTSSTRRCGRRDARRGTSIHRRAGLAAGSIKSLDGGDHLDARRGNGFPAHPGRIGLAWRRVSRNAVCAGRCPGRRAACIDPTMPARTGIMSSADPRIWQARLVLRPLTVDPKNAERLYVMNTIVLRSDDGGTHFIALKGDPTGDDFHALWIDPTDPDRQILGVDQGALVTLDGGTTWSSWYNQPTAQIYHVSTDNRFPYRVYGAQQDSGAAVLPSRTDSIDGITMQQFREISAGGESDMIAPDPDDPDIVYGGQVDKLDLRTGQTRNVDPTLAYPESYHRGTWTLPLVFAAGQSTVFRQPAPLPHTRRRRALGRRSART